MKISILCSSIDHPVYPYLEHWLSVQSGKHQIDLVQKKGDLQGGEILFLISCSDIIDKEIRDRYKSCLVIHASDLPKGRGWSPHIWQILEGKNEICISMIEAEDIIDSGAIWKQLSIRLEGHELYDEINKQLFKAELELMDYAVETHATVKPETQANIKQSYYPKRTPEDSQLDPNKSMAEQFDLLRISDPDRYPAYFKLRGHTYKLFIEKVNNTTTSNNTEKDENN